MLKKFIGFVYSKYKKYRLYDEERQPQLELWDDMYLAQLQQKGGD